MKILFYPHRLIKNSKAYNICEDIGIEYTNDINDNFDIIMFWDYNVKSEIPKVLLDFEKEGYKIINKECTNVSKNYTDLVHKYVFFGYCSMSRLMSKFHKPKVIYTNYIYNQNILRD